jgi:hypothetical protein
MEQIAFNQVKPLAIHAAGPRVGQTVAIQHHILKGTLPGKGFGHGGFAHAGRANQHHHPKRRFPGGEPGDFQIG